MDLMFGVHQRLMVTSSPCSNGIAIYKRMSILNYFEYFPFKTVIILQNTLGEKKMQSVIWKLLISLPTGTAIILNFMKLLIFLINIPFEQGEDVTIRCR